MQFSKIMLAAGVVALGLSPVHADEGMWTYNNFPADKVEKAYGFKPDQNWLDQVRLSSLRLARGCSGSFVSPRGLVQTNHHCARECIEQLSTAGNDLSASGFYAREAKDEAKCPDIEINQLISITTVTDRVNRATSGKDGAAFAEALKAENAKIASECSGNDVNTRCDVVELYKGGVYDLYKYRRYQDVRLVFAPAICESTPTKNRSTAARTICVTPSRTRSRATSRSCRVILDQPIGSTPSRSSSFSAM